MQRKMITQGRVNALRQHTIGRFPFALDLKYEGVGASQKSA